MSKIAWLWLLPICTLVACGEAPMTENAQEAQSEDGALIEAKSSNPDDPAFLSSIAKATPSDRLQFLLRWREKDRADALAPKTEFETTAEYEARRAEHEQSKEAYGSNCFAYVTEGNFSYDADTQNANFRDGSYEASQWDEPGKVASFDNVTFGNPTDADNVKMIARLDRSRAQQLRQSGSSPVRIVRIFSMDGLKKPAFNGWFVAGDPFQRLNPLNDAEFQSAIAEISSREFKANGELVKVMVFDGTSAGLKMPFFKWQAERQSCTRS